MAITIVDSDDAVTRCVFAGHGLDSDDAAAVIGVFRRHLLQTSGVARDEIIGQVYEERRISDRRPRAKYRVPQAKRLALPNVYARDPSGNNALNGCQ